MPTVQKLNHRHEQIINWLIMNPDRSLGDCAAFFGYTQPWLSTLIHTDMFQAAYRERCKEAGTVAVHTIINELGGLTSLAIEKSRERLEKGNASERFLGDTLNNCLKGLGYGAPLNQPQNTNGAQLHLHVDASQLLAARERVAVAMAGTVPAKALDAAFEPSTTQALDKAGVERKEGISPLIPLATTPEAELKGTVEASSGSPSEENSLAGLDDLLAPAVESENRAAA